MRSGEANHSPRLPPRTKKGFCTWRSAPAGTEATTENLRCHLTWKLQSSCQLLRRCKLPAIFLPRVGWFPNLIAPRGNFATGGKAPPKWDLVVSLPKDYHVLASGNPRGTDKSKARHGPGNSWRFEQISLSDFPPYVVAGPYIEEDVKTPTGAVILWTFHPVPEQRAHEIADRVSADVTFFNSEFGSPDQDIQKTWIVECPQRLPTEPRGLYTRGCLPMPGIAPMPEIFFEPNPPETQFLSVDYQLVQTWFMHSWSGSPGDTPWPMRDVAAYAVHSLLASRDATSREATIRNFVHYLDSEPREKQKPLIATTLEDSLMADGDPSALGVSSFSSRWRIAAARRTCIMLWHG